MTRHLDPDLAAALEALAELGPLQVLDVHPTPPGRRPASPPAAAGPEPAQPGLFDLQSEPAPPATTDPSSHIPPRRRWREVLRHAGAPPSPTDTEVPHVV
jgi:hypothetical protein